MLVECKYDELVAVNELKPHPQNRNKHSEEQIERLAQLLKYYGWRHSIIVSKNSGFIVAGHGRLESAKHVGFTQCPVSYQTFESEEQEYGFLVADNAIAGWAELDLKAISEDVLPFGPDFQLELLGLDDFTITPENINTRKDDKITQCPKCGAKL